MDKKNKTHATYLFLTVTSMLDFDERNISSTEWDSYSSGFCSQEMVLTCAIRVQNLYNPYVVLYLKRKKILVIFIRLCYNLDL